MYSNPYHNKPITCTATTTRTNQWHVQQSLLCQTNDLYSNDMYSNHYHSKPVTCTAITICQTNDMYRNHYFAKPMTCTAMTCTAITTIPNQWHVSAIITMSNQWHVQQSLPVPCKAIYNSQTMTCTAILPYLWHLRQSLPHQIKNIYSNHYPTTSMHTTITITPHQYHVL